MKPSSRGLFIKGLREMNFDIETEKKEAKSALIHAISMKDAQLIGAGVTSMRAIDASEGLIELGMGYIRAINVREVSTHILLNCAFTMAVNN